LSETEISKLFRKFNGNLKQAVVYAPPRQPTLFELYFRDNPIRAIFGLGSSTVERYVASPTTENVLVRLRGLTTHDITTKLSKVEAVEIHSVSRVSEPVLGLQPLLSTRELTILQCLLDWGFFALPRRGITLEQAASRLHVSDSQLSLELRKIADKVFKEYLRRATRFGPF
jgi:hypothetical protein